MTAEEMVAVVMMVSANPTGGDVIQSSRGLRKMRIPLQGRGKRGGGRVIYWYYSDGYPAVLMWAYAKNEAKDITAEQLKYFVKQAEDFKEQFGG